MSDIRVLIVDDQKTMRSIIRQLLAQVDITNVDETNSGYGALEKLERVSAKLPDVVICDLHMDDIDGMDFINKLRRTKINKSAADLPVLILTGDKDEFMHDVVSQVGATKVLTKPISAPDLKLEIEQAIGFKV